jgi:hypothetical protein
MGPTTIYSPFFQTSMINYRSSKHPFSDLSLPQDQDPEIYKVTFPGSPSILGPGGAFFSHHAQVHILMFKIIK